MPKKIEKDAIPKTWLSYDADLILKAFLEEASRMTTELLKWMEFQERSDPDMMAEIYEDEGLFDAIRTARKYRKRIYDQNRIIDKHEILFEAARVRFAADGKPEDEAEMKRIREVFNACTDEQMKWFWRITKIYSIVRKRVVHLASMGNPEFDPFAEYEYDPEKS